MSSLRPAGWPTAPREGLWKAYLAFGALVCALYLLVPPLKGSGPVIDGLGLYGALGAAAGIRLHRPRARLPWWCFVIALLLFWAGGLDVPGHSPASGARAGFPSLGDALHLAVYPVLVTGLLVLVRRRNKHADGPAVINTLIMSLGLALAWGILLIAPYVHHGTLSLLPRLVSIGYPTGDIILLTAAIRLAVDDGKRRPALYLLGASIVALLGTDLILGLLTVHKALHHQLWLDAGRILSCVLWGAAALHPSMPEVSEPEPALRRRLTGARLSLLAGATLIAPALEIARVLPRHDWDGMAIMIGSIALSGLVAARMAGLVRQREKAAARERAVTAAGGLLVSATEAQEIVIAALQTIGDFAQERIDARLCRIDGDGVEVMAINDAGALTDWTVPGETADEVRRCDDSGLSRLTAATRASLRLPDVPVLRLGLRPGSETGSALELVVAGRAAANPDTRNALRTLAQQVSFALGSAQLAEEVHRRVSEARFSTLVANSTDLITVLDAEHTIIYQSPSIERALGYGAEEVTGRPFAHLLHGEEQGRLLRRLGDGTGAAGAPELIECMLRNRDGEVRHFEILHANLLEDENVRGIVLNGRDVSERKAFEEQLAHQAFHDSVTHLPNRALFNERVRHAVSRMLRDGVGMAVLFVDLDDFKTVNDSLGHAAGDQVLLEVAKRITGSIRSADTAARFGGDEFAILLEEVPDVEHAAETAERILAALSLPLELDHNQLTIRASLGISVAEPGRPTDADELTRNADAAMYIAKGDGKGGYRVFEPAMHQRVVARLELHADLQRALAQEEFELHYQPLVRLADGAVTGVEALLRWRHPDRGLVAPGDFIPYAEESGLIVPIGRWVLHEGCRQAKQLREQISGPVSPKVSINLSVKQLFHPEVVADVRSALSAVDLEPGALTLEITESVMMTDIDLALTRLTELRELGVRLAMDDFGTGYSSLSYLSRFPVDILKMDRSLLGSGLSPETGLASAVLGLGETFALEVVAEGIEHPQQSATLRELGCETGQGFYFARPMPAEGLLEFLRDRSGDAGQVLLPTGGE